MPNSDPLVVDTSVVSILFTPTKRSQQKVDFYQTATVKRDLFISFQTVEELLFWAYRRNWQDKRYASLQSYIEKYTVIQSNLELSEMSASLRNQRSRVGHTLNVGDAWIAATALLIGYPLVTDDSDFLGIPNLEVIRYGN